MMMVQYNETIVNINLQKTDMNGSRTNAKHANINKMCSTYGLQHKNSGNRIDILDGVSEDSSGSNHSPIGNGNSIVAGLDDDFKSTLNLTAYKDNDVGQTRDETIETIDTRRIVHSIFERLCSQYTSLRRCARNLRSRFQHESTKTLAKQFRRSMRLNKSAKSKGYEYFMSDEDKRWANRMVFGYKKAPEWQHFNHWIIIVR